MDQPHPVAGEAVLRPFWQTAFLFCGILGQVIFLVIYFTFGSISPDFDMLRQPIGRLELLNYGWVQSVNFILLGAFTWAFAEGLRKELESGFGSILIPLMHVLTALGMIMMGVFIYEPAHMYVSFFSFITIVLNFFLLAMRFTSDKRWKGWALYTNFCGFALIILVWLFWYASSKSSNYAGIFEHVVVVIRLVWLVAFVLKLLWGTRLTSEDKLA